MKLIFENHRGNTKSNIWVFGSTTLLNIVDVVFSSSQVVFIWVSQHVLTRLIGFIHGDVSYVRRRELLVDLSSFFDLPLCIIGDFNAVLGAHECCVSLLLSFL